ARPAHLHSSAGQRHLSVSVAAGFSGGALRMKSRQELQRESARNPDGVAEYAFLLQEQLTEKDQLLAEARAYIAELKRQLFGPKADKLTPEQEAQLQQLTGDVQEQAQRPPPLSQEVLEPGPPPKDKEKPAHP